MRVAFLAALALWLSFSATFAGAEMASAAQQSKDKSNSSASKNGGGDKKGDKEKDKVQKKAKGDAIPVSQVLGMTVRNSDSKDGTKVGQIEDVVLEMGDSGRVRYAALSFGGFLGLGNKLIAVPWRALKFHHDADRDKNYVGFDATEARLKQAPGFDKDHWPNMADRGWMREADKHHGVEVYVGNTNVPRLTEAPGKQTTGGMHHADPQGPLRRGSEVIGLEVRNAVGDKLGKVEDIVVDMHLGDVRYLALSFGGFLGVGDKFFAVPLQAVSVQDRFVLFDVTKDQLKQADGFDKDQWPESGNDDWTNASHEDFPVGKDAD